MSRNGREFPEGAPIPRPGMTSVETAAFLTQEFQDVASWLCWEPSAALNICGLSRIPVATQDCGKIEQWTWTRLPVHYPSIAYCDENTHYSCPVRRWSGAIRVQDEAGHSFVLFACLSAMGEVGDRYFSSTADLKVLNQFAQATKRVFSTTGDRIRINVVLGEDIYLDEADSDEVYLPAALRVDIETQVDSFFSRPQVFEAYGIPRRRGFLFVGPPGNGKTMLMRHFVRHCSRKYGTQSTLLAPSIHINEGFLQMAFQDACANGPGILILDDLDTLTKECDLTRAGFLAVLDGIRPKEKVLVLASTNNPGSIDPALMHRPSRFDRVWHFNAPDKELRRGYLARVFSQAQGDDLDAIARGTDGWSFAYLNELRTTAAIMSVCDGRDGIPVAYILKAHELLADQFCAGRKNHVEAGNGNNVGFKAA